MVSILRLASYLVQLALISGSTSNTKQDVSLWIRSSSLGYITRPTAPATIENGKKYLIRRVNKRSAGVEGPDEQTTDVCAGQRLTYVQKAKQSSGWMGQNMLLDQLQRQFKAVDMLVHVPSREKVLAWGSKVVVMVEGQLMAGETMHYYDLVTSLLSHFLRYVAAPLVKYGRASHVSVLLHEEIAGWDDCAHYHENLTVLMLHNWYCKSPVFMLRDMFPDFSIEFEKDLPYCENIGKCHGISKARMDTTLLVLPDSQPVQFMPPMLCAAAMIHDVQQHFAPSSPTKSNQVTLIARGSDLDDGEEEGNNYPYARDFWMIPNMNELAKAVKGWSIQHGLDFEMLELERMPFSEQLQAIHRTYILIGAEGAGLANMVFLQEPRKSHVVELNWEGGKVENFQEYPTLANRTGVPLHMHVYGKYRDPVDPAGLLALLEKLV